MITDPQDLLRAIQKNEDYQQSGAFIYIDTFNRTNWKRDDFIRHIGSSGIIDEKNLYFEKKNEQGILCGLTLTGVEYIIQENNT